MARELTGLTSTTFKEIVLKEYLTVASRILDPVSCSLSDVLVLGSASVMKKRNPLAALQEGRLAQENHRERNSRKYKFFR